MKLDRLDHVHAALQALSAPDHGWNLVAILQHFAWTVFLLASVFVVTAASFALPWHREKRKRKNDGLFRGDGRRSVARTQLSSFWRGVYLAALTFQAVGRSVCDHPQGITLATLGFAVMMGGQLWFAACCVFVFLAIVNAQEIRDELDRRNLDL